MANKPQQPCNMAELLPQNHIGRLARDLVWPVINLSDSEHDTAEPDTIDPPGSHLSSRVPYGVEPDGTPIYSHPLK